MPDRLRERSTWIELVLVVVSLTAAGLVGAFVWDWLWTAPVGMAYDQQWVPQDEVGLQELFDATGWYVVVAGVAGLLAGFAVTLLFDRMPLLTLAGVVVGSILGTIVMLQVGAALGPADPQEAARTAADGTLLPGPLEVTGRTPWIAMPGGALIALTVVFVALGPRRTSPMDDLNVN